MNDKIQDAPEVAGGNEDTPTFLQYRLRPSPYLGINSLPCVEDVEARQVGRVDFVQRREGVVDEFRDDIEHQPQG